LKNLKKATNDEMLKRTLTGEPLNQIIAELSPIVEKNSFTKEVIISGFRDRGMWPFNKELILELAEKEWLAKTPVKDEERSSIALEAQRIMLKLIGEKKVTKKSEIVKVSGIPERNKLYTPEDLIQFDQKQKEEKEKQEEKKLEKKKEKEEAKKEKEQKAKEKMENKEAKKKKLLEEKENRKKQKEESRKSKDLNDSNSFDSLDESENDNINLPNQVVMRKRIIVDYNQPNTSGKKIKLLK